MNHNPILEELYAARERLLADADGDVHRFLEEVRKREATSGRLLQPTPQGTKDGAGAVGREHAAAAVAEARREFAAGQCQPMTAAEIMHEAQEQE